MSNVRVGEVGPDLAQKRGDDKERGARPEAASRAVDSEGVELLSFILQEYRLHRPYHGRQNDDGVPVPGGAPAEESLSPKSNTMPDSRR